jgi:hypothetical protein
MKSKVVPMPKDETMKTYAENESKVPRFLTSALYGKFFSYGHFTTR